MADKIKKPEIDASKSWRDNVHNFLEKDGIDLDDIDNIALVFPQTRYTIHKYVEEHANFDVNVGKWISKTDNKADAALELYFEKLKGYVDTNWSGLLTKNW